MGIRISLCFSIVLATAVPAANAFFEVEPAPVPASKEVVLSAAEINALINKHCGKSSLVEIGHGIASPEQGFGKSVPLTSALAILVSKKWHVYKHLSMKKRMMPVSWRGNRATSWLDILKVIADEYGLCMVVDWNHKAVLVASGSHNRHKQPKKAGATTTQSTKPKTKSDSTPKSNLMQSWHLKQGETLDQTLARWTKKQGWELAWEAGVRYRVPYDQVLHGKFLNVIEEVLTAYRKAKVPLTAIIHRGGTKKVLEIRPYYAFDNPKAKSAH